MKEKYKVLHVDYNYTLKTGYALAEPLLLASTDVRVANTLGTIMTINFDHNPYVNVDDEIVVRRYSDGRKYVENLTEQRRIADFIKQHQKQPASH